METTTVYYVNLEDGRQIYARRRFTDRQAAINLALTHSRDWCKKHGYIPKTENPECTAQLLHICLSSRSALYCNVERRTEPADGSQASNTFGYFNTTPVTRL